MKRKEAKYLKLNEDGKAILPLKISDDREFLSPYYFDEPLISDEVASYLSTHRSIGLWKDGVEVRLFSNKVSKKEETVYENAIHSYYREKLAQSARERKRNFLLSGFLFLLGLLVFASMFILDHFLGERLGMWSEVIDVVAWVFIWEAVDIAFIEGIEHSSDHRIAKNLSQCQVRFEKLKENAD